MNIEGRIVKRMTVMVLLACALGVLSVVAVVAVATPPAGAQDAGVNPQFAGWFLRCGYDYSTKADPIVSPGAESDHLHDFFGGHVTADSTYNSLLAGPTTCRFTQPDRAAGDHSGYWAPALYTRDGRKAEPRSLQAYSRTGPYNDPRDVAAWPNGSKLIVKDGSKGDKYIGSNVSWFCASVGNTGGANVEQDRPIEDCPGPNDNAPDGYELAAEIFTPNCTKPGVQDSTEAFPKSDPRHDDHFSHYAWSRQGGCPDSHPKEVPAMRLVFKYKTPLGQGAKVEAPHDPSHEGPMLEDANTGFHADFFNAWEPDVLGRLIDECIKGGKVCGEDGQPG